MGKLLETGDMNDTAPLDADGKRYVGPDVDKEGNLVCPKCGKPYAECTCEDPEDIHSKNIPDDVIPLRMGNVPQDKNEDVMDFYDGLDTLMLEEFIEPKKIEESMNKPTSEEEEKMVKNFTENFHAYLERNGDRIDRKPSDVGTKPNSNASFKVLYSDHFAKHIR